MTKHSRTVDEKYVLKLYELASAAGDMDLVMNRYEVGRMIGIQARGVDATCKLLHQANFIKKIGQEELRLTENGQQLALRILED